MTATYTYNGLGQRVKKVVDGVTTIFHYDEGGQLIAESNGSGAITAVYVYLNGQPLAKIEGTQVYYYHNDALGTPQKMTDSSGTVVWAVDYNPFGEATITVSTITNNLRGIGQYFDAETGLLYNYFRDLNPASGRYIEADPIGLRGGINLYAYVGNSPVNYTDIFGLAQAGTLPNGQLIPGMPNPSTTMPGVPTGNVNPGVIPNLSNLVNLPNIWIPAAVAIGVANQVNQAINNTAATIQCDKSRNYIVVVNRYPMSLQGLVQDDHGYGIIYDPNQTIAWGITIVGTKGCQCKQ
jgi:RHS repeat-associated protein